MASFKLFTSPVCSRLNTGLCSKRGVMKLPSMKADRQADGRQPTADDRHEGKIKKSDENAFIRKTKMMKMPSCRPSVTYFFSWRHFHHFCFFYFAFMKKMMKQVTNIPLSERKIYKITSASNYIRSRCYFKIFSVRHLLIGDRQGCWSPWPTPL